MQAEDGALLLFLARAALAGRLETPPLSKALQAPGASFVTLKQGEALRGCMGTLTPFRALYEDVEANAMAAAFRDPRFTPLTQAELPTTRIEVSVLSPSTPLIAQSEALALAQLRPGEDGVILEYGIQRATFLPQVWEDLSAPRAFLAALKRKAGLAENFWSADLRLRRYSVEKWAEAEDGAGLLQERRR